MVDFSARKYTVFSRKSLQVELLFCKMTKKKMCRGCVRHIFLSVLWLKNQRMMVLKVLSP